MHFIQPTQIWLSFRAKNLRVTSHETLLLPGFRDMQGFMVMKWVADYVAKSGSKSKMHGPEPFITVPYASCVSTVKD